MLHIYYCWCVDDQYLSPYQTRAKWLHWLLRKSGPLILTYMGPWGPHTSAFGVYLPLWVYGSSILITIPNQSQVAALVAKKKQALSIFIWAPGALDLHLWGQNGNTFSFLYQPHTCVKFGPWAYFSFWSTRGAKKFALGPLGPLTFILGAKMAVSFHPCNKLHKYAKFGPWGYFTF